MLFQTRLGITAVTNIAKHTDRALADYPVMKRGFFCCHKVAISNQKMTPRSLRAVIFS
jgi:hypothetical protein